MQIGNDARTLQPAAPETSPDARPDTHGRAVAARLQAEQVATASGVHVRELHTAEDCRELVKVFNGVWSTPADEDLIDMGVLVALAHAGNYVVLAERDGEPVGGGVGFFGPTGKPFHSHIVGVLATAAGRGVGRTIKLHQRAWCLDRGTDMMTWTYDPLVARNAYFNIQTLGARPIDYHHDFYGPMDDGINRGQYTDRMVIGWNLAAPTAPTTAPDGIPMDDHVGVSNDADRPGDWSPPPAGHAGPVLVGVPRDIEALRRDDPPRARRWREQTRTAFTALLADGWAVTGFRATGHYAFRQENR